MFLNYDGPCGGQPPDGIKVHKVALSDGLGAQGKAPCPTLMVPMVSLSLHDLCGQASQLAWFKSLQ